MTYFEDIDIVNPENVQDYVIKIQPKDELLITVSSENPVVTARYNPPLINPATKGDSRDATQFRVQTYEVNSDGDIYMPGLGKVHVAGMTTEQLREHLIKLISKEVIDPFVKVDLLNYNVYVLGEVKNPGRQSTNRQRFTLLDALSSAGDLTFYGRRDNVLLIREEPDGQRTYVRFNLNKAETLNSPYFFLKQNDYIYVEPTEVKQENAEFEQNKGYRLSVVSTIVSGVSIVVSLVIALIK